jgi:hypothetical protein
MIKDRTTLPAALDHMIVAHRAASHRITITAAILSSSPARRVLLRSRKTHGR